MGELSSAIDQLREQQRRLLAAVDAFEATPSAAAESAQLFREINPLVHEVTAARRDIPLRRHQAQRDRYDKPVRILGGFVTLTAAAAVVGAVAHWLTGWLALLALPLLVMGGRLVLTGAGERDQLRDGATPAGRLAGAIAALVAAVSVFLAAFVNWWVLAGAFLGVFVALYKLTLPTLVATSEQGPPAAERAKAAE